MKRLRRKTGENGFQHTTRNASSIRSKHFTRGILASATGVALSIALAACGGGDSNSAATPTDNANAAMVAMAKSAAGSSTVTLATSLKMNASSVAPDTQTDRFIVKYKSGTTERNATSAVQSRLDKLASAFPSRAHHLRRMGIGADVITTERKLNAKEAKAFMRAIASDPDVEYVEPDVPISENSAPNDPFYNLQRGLFSNLEPGQSSVGIRAANAWNVATGEGVTIGLIDNGITSHSDLNANVLPYGYDFTFLGPPDGSNPGIGNGKCQISYHGTHVAGIMAAVTNNSIGIAGVAPSAKLISARVLNQCGTGLLSSASDALMWAAGGPVLGFNTNPHTANVLNLSLTGPGKCSRAFQDSIDFATNHGVTVVVAAGNENADAANDQPGNCHGVITVGNTQQDGSRASDSNYGPTVDIGAPGTNIYSTYNDGTSSLGAESYAYMSGTSMATPIVTGVVALVKSVAPVPLSAAEIRTLIQQNAQPFPKTLDRPLGAGIVDASATVAAAKAGKIPVAADFTCAEWQNFMTITCTDLSTARGVPIKSWLWNLDTGYDPVPQSQTVNPFANYEYPGVYQVSLTVTDANGATSTLSRPVTVAPPAVTNMLNNYNAVVTVDSGAMQYYELDVPAGATALTARLSPSNNSDGAWFYIKAGSPSTIRADCQQGMANGNAATCTINKPAPGPYYVIVSPQSQITRGILTVSYQ